MADIEENGEANGQSCTGRKWVWGEDATLTAALTLPLSQTVNTGLGDLRARGGWNLNVTR